MAGHREKAGFVATRATDDARALWFGAATGHRSFGSVHASVRTESIGGRFLRMTAGVYQPVGYP
jgi:hypothetical protein